MYNTNFIVKYHEIETELAINALNDDECDFSEGENYSLNDIKLITDELYANEYLRAFNAIDYLDENIDINLRKIYTSLCSDEVFKNYIDELTNHYIEQYCKFCAIDGQNDIDDINYCCFISLFSKELFHITHRLICHFLNFNEINNDIFDEIKLKHLKFEN